MKKGHYVGLYATGTRRSICGSESLRHRGEEKNGWGKEKGLRQLLKTTKGKTTSNHPSFTFPIKRSSPAGGEGKQGNPPLMVIGVETLTHVGGAHHKKKEKGL